MRHKGQWAQERKILHGEVTLADYEILMPSSKYTCTVLEYLSTMEVHTDYMYHKLDIHGSKLTETTLQQSDHEQQRSNRFLRSSKRILFGMDERV